MKLPRRRPLVRALGACVLFGLIAGNIALASESNAPALEPMPEAKPGNADMIEMGRYLFFDNRLSGNMGVSCANCHSPEHGFSDGKALSAGYPSTEYFRNSPTLINSGLKKRFMWDGRLAGNDMGTLVRDMITEAHTMNMDSRLMQERLTQVPEYVEMWKKFRNDDINGMRVFNVVGEFVKTLQTENAPFDAFIQGDEGAISAEARAGFELFNGKAACVQCHNGPLGSDGKLHRTGVPEHPDVLGNPLRTITLLRHYATSGMPNYMNARTDVGSYAITKDPEDIGKFATPSLRDLKYTAPYMHNGVFATLEEVVDFYNAGGGEGSVLQPLNLTPRESRELIVFLLTLSGDPLVVEKPDLPDMQVRTLGQNY